jgi:hypothetical protein
VASRYLTSIVLFAYACSIYNDFMRLFKTRYSDIYADHIPRRDYIRLASPRGDSWQADCIVQDLLQFGIIVQ